jgi:hypothetical protein
VIGVLAHWIIALFLVLLAGWEEIAVLLADAVRAVTGRGRWQEPEGLWATVPCRGCGMLPGAGPCACPGTMPVTVPAGGGDQARAQRCGNCGTQPGTATGAIAGDEDL